MSSSLQFLTVLQQTGSVADVLASDATRQAAREALGADFFASKTDLRKVCSGYTGLSVMASNIVYMIFRYA
ncbi:hypothetical protein ACFL2V_08415 [Pseudomonadota bacterium]